MDRIVVDRSGIEYLLSTDSTFASSVQILAPTLLRSQILDGLYRSVASGLLTRAEGLERHDRFSRMKLRYLGDKVLRRTAWQIAEDRGWSGTQDAEFLALTRLQGDAFVTLDADLAARAKGMVELRTIDAVVDSTEVT